MRPQSQNVTEGRAVSLHGALTHPLTLPVYRGLLTRQRPLSIPPMDDRARHAISLQTLQPSAATTADPRADGLRPTRRRADAIDPCFQVLRQHTSATWILAGDLAGFVDHIAFAWLEKHIPMHKRGLSKWLRSGCIDRGVWLPTTAGVPQGGMVSPVSRNMGLDGLDGVGHGGPWHRRVHHSNLVMLERSAGKLARSVLRGPGGREPTWLPGGSLRTLV